MQPVDKTLTGFWQNTLCQDMTPVQIVAFTVSVVAFVAIQAFAISLLPQYPTNGIGLGIGTLVGCSGIGYIAFGKEMKQIQTGIIEV